jgi:hypothetical protein
MARSSIFAFALACLLAAFSFSQEKKSEATPPLLTFADLQKGAVDEAPFRIEGFVIEAYKCPPCPRGAMCKPCLGDHIVVTERLNEKDEPALIKRLRIFTDKPEQFELKKKYSFTVKVRGKPSPGRPIDAVELISFEPQPKESALATQSRDVIEAYRVCQSFERLIAKNLDFAEAYDATFVVDKARRRAIAIADGEFGDLDFAKIDDEALIKAYKLRMQIFYLMLPLASPRDAQEPVFFPPVIRAILERKAPTDTREFAAYVLQLERDAKRIRGHLDRLATDDPKVAERIDKFKSEALTARIEPPSDHQVEPSLGYIAAGVLGKNEAHYEINNYLVASEQGKMRIIGLRFFNRMF